MSVRFPVVRVIIWSSKITNFKFTETPPTECGAPSTGRVFIKKHLFNSFTFAFLL